MTHPAPVVFLLDVDNTLLDNDRIIDDLKRHLTRAFGAERQDRYWAIFEELRAELGYADYLGALHRYRAENPRDPNFLQVSRYLLDYPFADRLFPDSSEAIARLRGWGPTVILSDGDVVFQPRKIQRAGLFEAVEGRVLVYVHKERELDDVESRYKEEGTTTTPFDMCVLNQIDRFGLVKDVIERVTGLAARAGHVVQTMDKKLAAHKSYIREHGTDMPDIAGWRWGGH